MKCNICGGVEFGDMGKRKNVRCLQCNSLERTRLIWMHLERSKIRQDAKILHLAPEKGLSEKLRAIGGPNYLPADFSPKLYPWAEGCVQIDLCDLERWASREFDLIVHSHVLEHTPCNIAYTLYHLHRMLKDDGLHLMVIPFMPGRFDETFQDIGDAERIRRFGQNDHVRIFGNEDIGRHVGKLIKLPELIDADQYFTTHELDEASIPQSQRKGFHGSTVLLLGRGDMVMLDASKAT